MLVILTTPYQLSAFNPEKQQFPVQKIVVILIVFNQSMLICYLLAYNDSLKCKVSVSELPTFQKSITQVSNFKNLDTFSSIVFVG